MNGLQNGLQFLTHKTGSTLVAENRYTAIEINGKYIYSLRSSNQRGNTGMEPLTDDSGIYAEGIEQKLQIVRFRRRESCRISEARDSSGCRASHWIGGALFSSYSITVYSERRRSAYRRFHLQADPLRFEGW